jgi:hypothetical protein
VTMPPPVTMSTLQRIQALWHISFSVRLLCRDAAGCAAVALSRIAWSNRAGPVCAVTSAMCRGLLTRDRFARVLCALLVWGVSW